MSVFSSIMDKLGMLKDKAVSMLVKPAEAKPAESAAETAEAAAAEAAAVQTPAADPVDVVAVCEALAAKNPQKLNWKQSIVDLMKLLGLDSSLANRKILAEELSCPKELIGGDYSQMNIWLHKAVMQKLAENGGKVPEDLLK
jgi:3-oxoacyl-ACP reductase-like protein